jgi:hypothetical protein
VEPGARDPGFHNLPGYRSRTLAGDLGLSGEVIDRLLQLLLARGLAGEPLELEQHLLAGFLFPLG